MLFLFGILFWVLTGVFSVLLINCLIAGNYYLRLPELNFYTSLVLYFLGPISLFAFLGYFGYFLFKIFNNDD